MNDDDDSKKPLPRERWANDDERAKATKRVSQLLDAESGETNDEPDDPSMMEVYGAPPPEAHDLTPVYGAPEDDQPSQPVATRVYGMPAPVYGMPATRRPVAEPTTAAEASKPGSPRLIMFVVGGVIVAAAVLWWFSRS